MSELTQEQRDCLAWVRAEIDAREVLRPTPDDLPGRGALVRLPDGVLGEVLSWLDRNPNGDYEVSNLRIALVELTEQATDMSESELANQRIVPEDRMTLVRAEPSEEWLKRQLSKLEGRIQ